MDAFASLIRYYRILLDAKAIPSAIAAGAAFRICPRKNDTFSEMRCFFNTALSLQTAVSIETELKSQLK